ncbi:polyphosphate kinase 2 [Lutibacter sp. TH_r2]|uniref:polyphosphate kinase 2 n=1 Tax=Lutibacter sp. TH_r2 TaxID=3082083 RepID=UPI0029555029|nr:polyphosphate kinase 2 [Lutibacter sp. TH_r2]MDV7188409.1 polyphosphate kinase 2 [Lutibacter sp. TH_r2]
MREIELSDDDVQILNTNKGLRALLSRKPYNIEKAIRYVNYEKKLKKLQVELIRMQHWAIDENERIIVLFEGRDAAGKGGAIRRITERMNPRHLRIVALPQPTEDERSQWYFQRYVMQFPKAGEIVFFDRSWYNRAVVEPVNGFCTKEQHETFMNQVNDFERMIVESGIRLVKMYMSISKREQAKRFEEIKNNPLKQWKMTPVDEKAQELWDVYTEYKNKMFEVTKHGKVKWKIIKANRKTSARVNVINHVLKSIPYDKNKEI